ncbi:MAG: helix-turn-helix transcriptional regulator [Bacteroidales bacterium]|nr:helix-turn-helix transcriptional regulator [Bacteroidales bacterium]
MEHKLDMNKVNQLPTVNEELDSKYGKEGTRSRDEFNAKTRAWYYAECLKEARKKAGLTQQDVAKRIGKKREYVALIERGETDMQLSTFIMMSEAVGLHFVLTY